MSDPLSDGPAVRPDDDTSVGAVTQGGHGTRRGNSWWWIIIAAALAIAVALAWISTRHGDVVGQGAHTAALGRHAGGQAMRLRLASAS